MHRRQVVPLFELTGRDQIKAGSKAVGQARLARAGMPVPPGFCVAASAYREHLEDNALLEEARGLCERYSASLDGEGRTALESLRARIVTAPMREELKEEIAAALRTLQAEAVAVRSTATAEDLPESSFAGQYDTYLDIHDPAGCLEAVKRCWASLWTERAFDYRTRNGFDHLAVDMAVMVQCMVPAEAAGVVFSADPVTGRADRMIVEAVPGLGEALVSGRIAPDRFVVSKQGLRVLSSSAAAPCIGEDAARLICLMAMRAEAVFGQVLDLEWASEGGRVFLLQARPITTLGRERSWEDRQVWSNINVGEVLPDVVTPATWSLVEIVIFKIFVSVFGRMGIDFGENPIVGQVAGRAYFNLNTMTGTLDSISGLWKMDVGEILGGGQELKGLAVPREDIPDLDFSMGKFLRKAPSFLAWVFANSLEKGDAFLGELREMLARLWELDVALLSDGELVGGFDFILDFLGTQDDIIGFAARGMYYFMTLDRICRTWLKDYRGITTNRLCSGLPGMESAEAGYQLWRLAVQVRTDPEVEDAVARGESFEACKEVLTRSAGGRDFLASWDAFMTRHGHHTRGELEVLNPRWSEEPDRVLGMLRAYLGGMDRLDPLAKFDENVKVREEMTGRCRRLLRNPLKRRLFDYFLAHAQHGLIMRENVKNEAVRCIAVMRFLLLETGRRLAARGILRDEESVFFLSLEETLAALNGAAEPDAAEKALQRREQYEKNLSITPPKIIFGVFDAEDFVADDIDLDAEELTGLSVSPGVVSGPARVMLRSDDGHVLPGEIMVAPFTDPGWTPHFLTAAGIVMDMGGLLSHGSIVAREYGIPTVVNVGPATQIIRTGQRIQVDADRGIVRIIRDT